MSTRGTTSLEQDVLEKPMLCNNRSHCNEKHVHHNEKVAPTRYN